MINMNMKCFLILLISFICFANARQIRYSRYNTEVIEDSVENQNGTNISDNQTLDDDNEIEATVREIKLAPYPASGFRPSRAFPLPNDGAERNAKSDIEAPLIDESVIATTTDTIDLTTTTEGYHDSEITTIINTADDDLNEDDSETVANGEDDLSEVKKPKAPYPPAGFQPKIPFLLPTDNLLENMHQRHEKVSDNITKITPEREVNTKAFLLPSEQLLLEEENKSDNSNHPVCGSSTNPLAPKPLDVEKEDPDSEPINIDGQIKQRSPQQRTLIIPVRFSVHPLLLTRPLVYSAPIPSLL